MKNNDLDRRNPVRPARRTYDVPKPMRVDNAPIAGASFVRQPAPELPENLLVGRNPIREALKSGAPMEKLIVSSGDLSGAARDIIAMARERGVIVQEVDRSRLDAIYPAHQGMLAYTSAKEYSSVEDILAHAKEQGEPPFIVVLDGVTDPQNLGAVIRTAECAGVHGVIIPERRAAGLTPACKKAAAGALAYMRVARVTNIPRTLDTLKSAGLWIYAADVEGDSAFTADMSGAIAIVIGGEDTGVSRLALERSDVQLSLPMRGQIGSLNASVAAGILIYQAARARGL